jgi:hypothetical protein
VVFVGLGVLARRNVALVGLGVLPLVAGGLGPLVTAADGVLGRRPFRRTAVAGAIALAFAAGAASVITGGYYEVARLSRTFGVGESALFASPAAVDFLDAEAAGERIFNDDGLGGYLLWQTYPRRRVFIDGRLQVYPPSVYAEYQAVLDDPSRFPALAARYGITAAILYHPAPGRLELARAIATVPGWRVGYVDGAAVVLLHEAGRAVSSPRTGPIDQHAPGRLDRALAFFRPPVERAIAHYQRGRALLYLLGRAGIPGARADFETALRLWPRLEEAAIGLAATRGAVAR